MKNITLIFAFIVAYTVTVLPQDDWTLQTPPVSPSVRAGHAMAYIGDDKVLMFGGALDVSASNLANDTWVYDLSENTWTQKSPSTSPSPRCLHTMAYIGDDKVLLFGGGYDFDNPVGYSLDGETWIYDLSDDSWTQMTPSTAPSARFTHGMVFVGNGQVFLYGGADDFSNTFEVTWVYDLSANNWTQAPTTYPCPCISDSRIVSLGGDQVLFLGTNDPTNKSRTWLYDLSDNEWYLKNEVTLPTPSSGTSMAHIAGSDWVLLFGGNPSILPANGTFIYDLSDNTWSLQSPVTIPDHRSDHAMASISAGKVLMFGGFVGADLNNETWIYAATLPAVTHTILATAGAGGSITPSGPVVVNQGDDQSLTITPDANYEIADVLVDGISVGIVVLYEFNNVTADHTIVVSFSEPNTAPQFVYPTPDEASTITVYTGSPINFTVSALESDAGDNVILTAIGLPSGSSMVLPASGNPASSDFSWTPLVADVGTYSLTFTATDNSSAQAIRSFILEVVELNVSPEFVTPTPECGTTLTVEEGSPINFTIAAADLNSADIIILSVSDLPAGSSMDPSLPANGNPVSSVFSWIPSSADVGNHTIIFTADDNSNDPVSCSLLVEVTPIPPPPTNYCPLSQGYWKTHTNNWPASALPMMLGTLNTYDQSELLSLFNAAPRGDASIILAHQLMAAKLNVANGSPLPTEVQDAIEDADAAIGELEIPAGIKAQHPLRATMIALSSLLDDYNNKLLTPNCVQMPKNGTGKSEVSLVQLLPE